VCGAKIRQTRAEEINGALLELMNTPIHWGEGKPRERSCPIDARDQATTGTALLLTLTAPHDYGEPLRDTLNTIRTGHQALTSGRQWMEDKETFRLVGYIRAHDATNGRHGWHPHMHSVLCVSGELTAAELTRLKRRLYLRWARSIVGARPKLGQRGDSWEGKRRAPTYAHGIHLEQARSVEDVARYAAEIAGDVDEGASPAKSYSVMVGEKSRVGLELTRNDLKTGLVDGNGKRVSRTPWEILRDIREAPVCDEDGVVNEQRERDLTLWREWEQETRGVQAMRWSSSLKAVLGVLERADEELVGEEVGGETVHEFTTIEWWAVCGTRGAPTIVLERAEESGGVGVREYLAEIVPAWQEQKARDREWEQRHPELMRPHQPRRAAALTLVA
jgi:hypothetical protein